MAIFFILLSNLLLLACSSEKTYAPVVDGWKQTAGQKSGYLVQKKDTVYSIAWDYGMDYRDIVKANHLHAPYTIRVGQRLKMSSSHQTLASLPPKHKSSKVVKTEPKEMTKNKSEKIEIQPKTVHVALNQNWKWPTQGHLIKNFCNPSNHGIDIGGKLGQNVVAASSGKVVYAGDGLRGYGNLIIIKHNESYLSAYAFNKTLLVKEGMSVQAGQKIATMGKDDAGCSSLHFEIRRDGKPVNPMLYLPRA